MTIPLVIGCPVYRRAWILDEYFDSLEAQTAIPDGTRLIFAVSYDEDGRDPDGTAAVIERRWPTAEILEVPGVGYEDTDRAHPARFAYLADVRNRLLRAVAALEPTYYLSWDSDILLQPTALVELVSAAYRGGYGATGALVDMGGEQHPGHWSFMTLDGDDAYRPHSSKFIPEVWLPEVHPNPFQVGVVMGCKLLSPAAYRNTRYVDHILGEDIGWALQCEAMGVTRWIAPAARGVHRWRLPAAEQLDEQ